MTNIWDDDEALETSVTVDRKRVSKREVPLGREFIESGRLWQTTLGTPIDFDRVLVGDRFKFGDAWGVKRSSYQTNALARNLPFGKILSQEIKVESGQKVKLLEVNDRGAA